jgi:Fic family protein
MIDKSAENLPSDPAEYRTAGPVPKPKTETLRKLLARRTGATVVQIQKQLGWQPHTIRAAISRLRSLGVTVELDRSGRVARYRIVPGEGQ